MLTHFCSFRLGTGRWRMSVLYILSCVKKMHLAPCVLGFCDIGNCCLLAFPLDLNRKQCLPSHPIWKLLRFFALPPLTKQGQSASWACESNSYYLCSIRVTYILKSKFGYRCVGWQGLASWLCETCFHYSMRRTRSHSKLVVNNDSLYSLCVCDPNFTVKRGEILPAS